ncbi:MAG: DNRLRE domain-containing protein [Verrucomicrobiia bacterium]
MKRILLAVSLLIPTLFLQAATLDLVPTKDTTIYQDGELSNGGGSRLIIGADGMQSPRRSLLQFDFSAIPVDAVITNAALRLDCVSVNMVGPRVANLHRLTQAWGEGIAVAVDPQINGSPANNGDATWTNAFVGSVAWLNPGGDFVQAPSATVNVDDVGAYVWNSAQLLADVKTWVTNATANQGWIVIGDETAANTIKSFASRSSTNSPVLTVGFSTNVILSGVTFEKLRPKTGKKKNFRSSRGIVAKGRVITTNQLDGGFAFLVMGSNQPRMCLFLNSKI